MKNWYTTREGANLQHKSQPIKNGKRIFLTAAQARLHGDTISEAEAPTMKNEVGVSDEWDEWLNAKGKTSSSNPETTENQEKKSFKAKT